MYVVNKKSIGSRDPKQNSEDRIQRTELFVAFGDFVDCWFRLLLFSCFVMAVPAKWI